MRREVDTTEAFRGQMLRPESMLRVVRVHAGTVILPELGEKLGANAQNNWRNEASRSM